MMFGEPTPANRHTGTMPDNVILTPQGTFKAIVKRNYLGTFKTIEEATNAVSEHLNDIS